MNPISQSIWFLLKHSIVTLVALALLTIVFIIFQVALITSELEASQVFQVSILINLTLSTFLGVYLGGGLFSLKQNYLWTINQHYRGAIMAAYLSIAGVCFLIQSPFIYLNLDRTAVVLLAPFCVTIFSSQMVLGKTVIHKVVIPAVPYLIVQLHRINVSDTVIVLLIMISAGILLYSMYRNRLYPDSLSRKKARQGLADGMGSTSTWAASSAVTSFDHVIGVLVSKQVTGSRGNIDWAVLRPHTKLALRSALYVLIIMLFVLLTGDEDKQLLEALSILFLSTSIINIVMESRLLIRQTRYFAHLFSGPGHRQLKNKILFSMDKSFLTNCLVFIIGVLIAAKVFSLTVNTPYLLWSSVAVILIGFATYPALLCLGWINLSFSQIFSVAAYALVIFLVILWINTHTVELFLSPYPLLFVVACFLVRSLTQILFWQRPFESLLKNK